mmetsp:Transcript_11735/g.24824  ORF Transcript_11735/g.24824 Transcript_11735/m.24824 type:complete len:255 (+) Transcript_11735:154-918(+)
MKSLIAQSFVSLVSALFLFHLPRSAESCMSCYHPKIIPKNQNTQYQSQAIAIAVPHGMHPYGASSRTNSIAVATTAARQFLEICKKRCLNLQKSICTLPPRNKSLRISAAVALATGGMVVLARHRLPATTKHRLYRNNVWRNVLADGGDNTLGEDDGQDIDADADPRPEEEETVASAAMIATIGVYKNFISPLLPPACRFVPTCSQYGVQAIKEYGSAKGVILTSWRLLRCSPFGGKGYDPPKWPPVSYTYSSY